jgi:hypothetical protein
LVYTAHEQQQTNQGIFMKMLLTVFVTLVTVIAIADVKRPNPRPTPPGRPDQSAVNLTVIQNAQYSIKMLLPKCATTGPVRCQAQPSAVLELVLPLVGCVDSAFVSYSISENPRNNDLKVTVSALNISNPQSAVTRCAVAPTAIKKITLGATICR